MMSALTAAGVAALLAEPEMFELWTRAKGGRWSKATRGTHAHCVGHIKGPGDFAIRIAPPEPSLGLFEGCDPLGEPPGLFPGNASHTAQPGDRHERQSLPVAG